jgi:hypothetical protein
MANFVITGLEQSSQTLLTGQHGTITQSGALVTSLFPGVVLDGNSNLYVAGELLSLGEPAVTTVSNFPLASILIAPTGSVVSQSYAGLASGFSQFSALQIAVTDTAQIVNHGFVSGAQHGVNLTGGGDHIVTNTGHIEGLSEHGLRAFLLGGALDLDNSGAIEGDDNGLIISLGSGGGAAIANSGVISGSLAAIEVTDSGGITLDNIGTITGDVTLGSGSHVVRNVGSTITGDVSLNRGDDLFNGRLGTHDGSVDGSVGNDVLLAGMTLADMDGTDFIF